MNEKVSVVTGGSAGIGRAICQGRLDAGDTVINIDRVPPSTPDARLTTVLSDLTDMVATEQAAAEVAHAHQVTTFVHNAGVIRPAPVADVTLDSFDELTALHLKSAVVLLQAFLPSLREANPARVVLISSRAALGLPTRTAYSATKAGIIGLTRTWALELAEHDITVNALAPGPIAGTPMFHEQIPPDSEVMQTLGNAIPLGRLGAPADVANAVDFFVDEKASFITGQVLYVCGGSSVGSLSL